MFISGVNDTCDKFYSNSHWTTLGLCYRCLQVTAFSLFFFLFDCPDSVAMDLSKYKYDKRRTGPAHAKPAQNPDICNTLDNPPLHIAYLITVLIFQQSKQRLLNFKIFQGE
jgi:hypothetical protein